MILIPMKLPDWLSMDQTLLKQTRFNTDNDNYNKVMILKTKY